MDILESVEVRWFAVRHVRGAGLDVALGAELSRGYPAWLQQTAAAAGAGGRS